MGETIVIIKTESETESSQPTACSHHIHVCFVLSEHIFQRKKLNLFFCRAASRSRQFPENCQASVKALIRKSLSK